MKILFYLAHPAHYHLFKNVILNLRDKNHDIAVLMKNKDILEYLLKRSGVDFLNISPKGRKDNKLGIAIGLFKRDLEMIRFCLKQRPDILIGTSVEIAHVGKLLNIPSLAVNEDDYDAVPLFSMVAYPFVDHILAPVSCPTGPKNGRWEKKTIHYEGFHELAYLHPSNFEPNRNVIANKTDFSNPYAILRFARLTAHHDKGKNGITTKIAQNIIDLLKTNCNFNIYITSERELEPEFEAYRITVDPIYMHHALYYADMYIGDSQTMAAEAAVLGTPSIRFNDFVGKLGYLEELEHEYNLTYGIKTSKPQELYQKIEKLLRMPNLKEEWGKRRHKMLTEKIDVTAFMVWLISNYPKSIKMLEKDPNFQFSFNS